jgi:hypothetical protein
LEDDLNFLEGRKYKQKSMYDLTLQKEIITMHITLKEEISMIPPINMMPQIKNMEENNIALKISTMHPTLHKGISTMHTTLQEKFIEVQPT